MPHDEGPEIMQAKLEKCQWYGKSNSLLAEIKSDPISSKSRIKPLLCYYLYISFSDGRISGISMFVEISMR